VIICIWTGGVRVYINNVYNQILPINILFTEQGHVLCCYLCIGVVSLERLNLPYRVELLFLAVSLNLFYWSGEITALECERLAPHHTDRKK